MKEIYGAGGANIFKSDTFKYKLLNNCNWDERQYIANGVCECKLCLG